MSRSGPAELFALATGRTTPWPLRQLAAIASAYERAPLRTLLFEAHEAWALDGVLVWMVRRILTSVGGGRTAAGITGDPPPSGWRGNLLFVAVWGCALAAIAIVARRLMM